jgi:excinuclease ABC subunit B
LNGEVILYADVKTLSIQKFLAVTEYRRKKQVAYNQEHNITPRSVSRAVEESLSTYKETHNRAYSVLNEAGVDIDFAVTIKEIEEEMLAAANNLEFEKAALMRDQIRELKRAMAGEPAGKTAGSAASGSGTSRVSYGKGRGRKPSTARSAKA